MRRRPRGRRRSVDRGTYRPGIEPRNTCPAAQAAGTSGCRRRGGRRKATPGCTAIARCTRIPRGQRPRACTETPCAGTGRSRVCLRRRERQTASGSRRTYADDERTREVGQPDSTCEAAEQSRGTGSGGGGGKGAGQGELARAQRAPDSEPGKRAQRARAGTSSSKKG